MYSNTMCVIQILIPLNRSHSFPEELNERIKFGRALNLKNFFLSAAVSTTVECKLLLVPEVW